jgi:hypothetical protein
MKSIIAIAVALSLSACGSMQTNADGSVTATNLDGSVCTYVGFHKTCKSAIEVSMDKDDQDMAAYAAKARQQRQEEAAAAEKVRQAALAEAETKAEADRAAAEAFAKTPEGIAQDAAEEKQREQDQRDYEARERESAARQAAEQKAAAASEAQQNDPRYRAKYVANLEKKYGNIIRFDSAESMRAIGSFNIDCHMSDHRVLPLYNVILATAASDEKMSVGANTHMWYEVQSAGGETRVVRGLQGQSRGEIFLIIDKWGEMHSTHIEAMENACALGTYGPIWN